ncbi:MAG: hypothetical protein VW443_02350 [Pseudomonadales bacterium]
MTDTQEVKIEGFADLMGIDIEQRRRMEWSFMGACARKAAVYAMRAVADEERAGRTNDARNDIEALAELEEATRDAFEAQGANWDERVTNADNLERWIRVYYSAAKHDWRTTPTKLTDAFAYFNDKAKEKASETEIADAAKFAGMDNDTLQKLFNNVSSDHIDQTAKRVNAAAQMTLEVTRKCAEDGFAVSEHRLPSEWSDVVQAALESSKRTAAMNSRANLAKFLSDVADIQRYNIADIEVNGTLSAYERDRIDRHYDGYTSDECVTYNNPPKH